MYLSDIIEAVEQFGSLFIQVYGQGECPMGITVLLDLKSQIETLKWKKRLQSVGYAQSAVEVKIGNKEGAAMTPGEIGEIMVRGELVMPGYWDNRKPPQKQL